MAHAKKRTYVDRRVRWTAVYNNPLGPGTLSAGTYDTKEEAIREAQRREIFIADGTWIDPSLGEETVASFVDRYLEGRKKAVQPTTFAGYSSIVKNQIKPGLGRLALRSLSKEVIQLFIDRLEGRASPKTIRNVHTFLRTALQSATDARAIPSNPAIGVTVPPLVKNLKTAITPVQFERLLGCVDSYWQLLVETAAESGARWGELLGLTGSSLYDEGILIRNTIIEIRSKDNDGLTPFAVKAYPKGRKFRRVGLPSQLMDKLRTHIKANALGPDDYLFTRFDGGHPSRGTFRNKVWLPAVEAAALDVPLRFHDLRGSHATWLLAGGADLKAVMHRLGWKNLETAQDYLGILPDEDDAAQRAMKKARKRFAKKTKKANERKQTPPDSLDVERGGADDERAAGVA